MAGDKGALRFQTRDTPHADLDHRAFFDQKFQNGVMAADARGPSLRTPPNTSHAVNSYYSSK